MSQLPHVDLELRVTNVRSRGSFGGVIFTGRTDTSETYVVKASYALVPDASLIETAQRWRVSGPVACIPYLQQGMQRSELQIRAEQLSMIRPSGKHLVAWIAESPECRGIGEVKARRLYDRFGEDLVDLIETAQVDQLVEVVDELAAAALVEAFARAEVLTTLSWLDQLHIPRPLGAAVVRYWGKDARNKVEADPYVLISFCADWKTVDDLAAARFGVKRDAPCRLIAACEEALYRAMGDGDTALRTGDVVVRLGKLVGSVDLAREAIRLAVAGGKVLEVQGDLQPLGLSCIESTIARTLSSLMAGRADDQADMFGVELPDRAFVQAHLAVYEASNGLELTAEQRSAVVTSATRRFSLILGGAGTGKTTVLRALCHTIEQACPGSEIYQLALAGRAAQRMSQATGRPASTIAAFLKGSSVAPGATVIVDEMSMVDVLLMYRLLKHLPHGIRLVLVGDPAQLPPIGPGLVLHALDSVEEVPQTLLRTVKRQSAVSGIPQAAQAVRLHQVPSWAEYPGAGSGVSVVPCDDASLDATVLKVYEELGGDGSSFDVQIVCATRNGPGGVKPLNALVHQRLADRAHPVLGRSDPRGLVFERTEDGLGLFVGDLVIYGTNDYGLGLRNGSLGVITAAPGPRTGPPSVEGGCTAEFEGVSYDLGAAQVTHLKHAYAITTHKSQGSQFNKVIVPVRRNKLLDNALVYTALTRGVSQVVVVGDVAALREAIERPSRSSTRTTRLGSLMETALASTTSSSLRTTHSKELCP